MKQQITKIAIVLLFALAFTIQPVQASTNWNAFSANIEHALKTDNLGLKQSALRLIIKHGGKLEVENALNTIVDMYKNGSDEETRELALLAIFRMDSKTAMELMNERIQEDFNSVMMEKLDKYLSKY